MAMRLLDGGYALTVRDLRPQCTDALLAYAQSINAASRVQLANSSSDVALQSNLLIVCVVDAAQTASVLFDETANGEASAVVDALKHRNTNLALDVMLCPTISPEDTERFATQLAEHGVNTLDAPMSGGPARAREGTMSLMVAAAQPVYARHEALLKHLASRCFYLGERIGDGARTKLVNNLLASINLVGAAECMALAKQLSLNLNTMLQVIEQSSGQSWIGVERMRRALAHNTAPLAHMSLLTKDSALAMQSAKQQGFDAPLGALAAQIFQAACDAGLRDADDAALLQHCLQQNIKVT